MMKYLLFLTSLFITQFSHAQTHRTCGHQLYHPNTTNQDYLRCANPAFKSSWLLEYQKNPTSFIKSSPTSTSYLPLSIHIVGNDDSTNYGSLNGILAAICQANEDFKASNIQFYIEYPIHYIPQTSFNNHQSPIVGGAYMQQNETPNTINLYFVSNAAGACGYTLPYAGIALNYSCLSDHSLSHELGHAFSLPHTFNGWEGGYSSTGSTVTNFPSPAPDTIYKQAFKEDTSTQQWSLGEDTLAVEMVARTGTTANCTYAGDGFCDTEADYLAFRWFCNSSNESNDQQLDPDSVAFFSDGTNLMSYSMCPSVFSTEQQNTMNAYIQSELTTHLYNQNPTKDTLDINNLTAIAPLDGSTTVDQDNVVFRWSSVPGATHYLLKVCAIPCSSTNLEMEEVLLTDTFYVSPIQYAPRVSFFPYRWQVSPFNQGNTCAGSSPAYTFNTQVFSGIPTFDNIETFNVFPNPSPQGSSLTLEATTQSDLVYKLRLTTLTGQLLLQKDWSLKAGINTNSIALNQLTAGVYLLHLDHSQGSRIEKIIVTK